MSRFVLVSRSAEYESRLRRLLRGYLQTIPGEYLVFGPGQLIDQVDGAPHVALLGPLLSFDETRALSAGLAQRYPGIGLVVVREHRSDLEDWVDDIEIHAVLSPEASDGSTEELLARLDAWLIASGRVQQDDPADTGAMPGAGEPQLVEILDAGLAASATAAAAPTGIEAAAPSPVTDWVLPELGPGVQPEVIVVTAPKGGQGKTTVAVNLAAGLAEVAPNSVVLVDGDLQFGDVANTLDLAPHYSLAEMIEAGDDEVALKALLTRHAEDYFVVPAPASPETADLITPNAFGALLDRLSSMFRFVVVDTSPGLSEHTLAALEHATDGVFLSALSVPSLRALRRELEVLATLGLFPPNRHLIVNFVEKNNGLIVKDAQAIVGAPFDVAIQRSLEVAIAANAGVAVLHRDPRAAASKGLREMVQRIEPRAEAKQRRMHRADIPESEAS